MPQKKHKILIIDDDEAVAETLQFFLADIYDSMMATDGERALDLLRQQRYDLIFCDLAMPRISGMDLYETIRREFPGLERSIVFMSGGACTEKAAEFITRVPNLKIEKPFSMKSIRALVGTLLDGK